MARLLVQSSKVDIGVKDIYGMTPLLILMSEASGIIGKCNESAFQGLVKAVLDQGVSAWRWRGECMHGGFGRPNGVSVWMWW